MGNQTVSRHGTQSFLVHPERARKERKAAESRQTSSEWIYVWHVALDDFRHATETLGVHHAEADWCPRRVLAPASEEQPLCVDLIINID